MYVVFRKHSIRNSFEIKLGSNEIQFAFKSVLINKYVRSSRAPKVFGTSDVNRVENVVACRKRKLNSINVEYKEKRRARSDAETIIRTEITSL